MAKVKHHLSVLPAWSTELAADIAVSESIELGPEHIEILHISRAFYDEYGFSPSMRPLCKSIAGVLGSEKGRSLYLNQLFPGSPAKLVALLAGLPKPKNCL